MSTKKNIIKKSGTIALATVLAGSSLLSTLPVNVFASEAALKSALLAAVPANATEVATFAELKAALVSTSITDIKLTANIKVASSFNFTTQKNLYGNGFAIDMDDHRIGISKADLVNRVEDLTITNQDIYPLFWSEYKGVQVTYKDVTSSGEQFVYNLYGTTILEGNVTASANQEEVYQGTTLTIAGGAKVDFTSTSGCPAIRLYGSLTQEANSDLKVNAKDYAIYGHNSNTQISVAGNMDLTSTGEQAIYTAGSGGNMIVKTGAKFKAAAGDLTEEGISITSGTLTVQTGADFVATSPGKQGTVQTGGKLVFENGSNFAITNTNAVGSVFANYAGSSTNININSDKGLSTWDSGRINDTLPTHNYNDFTTATLDLSGWDKGNISQKNLTSNSAQFQSQFVSKTTAKLFGGSYAMTNIAQTTIDELTTDSTKATGVAEPNANIVIKDAAGNTLGTGKVGSDGYYSIAIPKQAAGTEVTATATANGITSSATTTVKQAAIAQTTIASLTTDSTTATGTAEPNAAIEIKANGEVIGSGKVGSDGAYSITISQQDVGTRVTATATVGEVTSSATATVTQGELDQTTIAALTTKSTLAEGTAQANASIQIKNNAGDVLGSGKVGSDGKYSITIPKQAAGTVVTATATSNGKTSTAQTTVVRGEIDQTTINKVTTESTSVSGTAEANSTLVVKDQDGNQIATGRVGSDGIYSLTIAKQAEGTVLTATATLAGFTSAASTIVERDGINQTTINSLTTDSTSASGTAEPNSTIVLKDQDGKQLATGRVGSDGLYSLTIPKQAEGTVVTATATVNGKTSTASTTVVRDGIAATTIDTLTADATTVTGTGEPNAAIVIKNASGTTIGSGTVGSDGKYSMTIPKQAEGTVVTATATKGGKTSNASTTVTPGENIAATTINALTTDSTSASGKAEPNADIVIKAGSTTIATGKVGSDGNYSLTIPKQVANTVVTATATKDDKTSNASTTVAPGQSIEQTTINALTNDSTTVSGKGEPNADIVVKAGSTTIATGKVGSDGNYSLTIPKQAPNTVVTATATKDGQTSSATATVTKQATGSVVVTAPYYVGYDSNIKATVSGDATKVYLQVGDTKYTTVPVSGSFTYYAKDKITTTSQDAYLVALDASGKELSRAKVTLKDGALLKGTVAADEFIVGATNYVTGSFTGSVTKVAISVNGTVYPAVAVGTGNKLQYYAKDKILNKTDVVKLIGYNSEGASIATTDVPVAGPESLTGVITPNPSNFAISTDSYVKGTFTGNVKTVSLVINGVESAKVSVMDATNWQYYAKGKIVNPTDDVSVKAYNAAGTLVDTKSITVSQNPAGQSTITPAAFKLKTDTNVKGTFTGSVKYVALKVGDTTYSKVAVVDGTNWQYYAKDKITDATTPVSIIGYDSTGTQIVTADVTVTPENTSTLTADKYTLGDSNVTGKYTGAVKYVGVKINDTTYSKVPVNADGSYQYYIKDKVGSKDDVITVLGYDSTGAVAAQATVTIDPGVAPTMTADEFVIGTTRNVTGSFTGGVKYVGLQVGDTVYSKVPVNADGTYQYYAKDKIADTATTVTVLGYDATGAVAVQAVVDVK
ncbi:autolysin modifier protein [Listeria weihenstephanensis]|uniref:Autolysin modifier protein n=1 Tax=Listeria weihenstephanensis TaxID=1006155 RepID=A0A841ZBY2_9LIST|nr:immunoglobulin-like domain-containing protein [Listeria weihenstephanensis]MBC1501997.1 autolysin modifier protein [Listeria weihenstephanensis]